MNHARLVCNQKEKFQCAECRKLTSSGYQLIGDEETKFVCKECYVNFRREYPSKGKSIKHLLPAEEVFSDTYNPSATTEELDTSNETENVGYIGELVPDGNGGWREPTAEELEALHNTSNDTSTAETASDNSENTINIRYRFTTDNKLQVILPRKCRIDDRTYELIVTTEE